MTDAASAAQSAIVIPIATARPRVTAWSGGMLAIAAIDPEPGAPGDDPVAIPGDDRDIPDAAVPSEGLGTLGAEPGDERDTPLPMPGLEMGVPIAVASASEAAIGSPAGIPAAAPGSSATAPVGVITRTPLSPAGAGVDTGSAGCTATSPRPFVCASAPARP